MDLEHTLPPRVKQHPWPVRLSVECIPLASSETYTRVSQHFEDTPDPGFSADHTEVEVTVQGMGVGRFLVWTLVNLDFRRFVPGFLCQARRVLG